MRQGLYEATKYCRWGLSKVQTYETTVQIFPGTVQVTLAGRGRGIAGALLVQRLGRKDDGDKKTRSVPDGSGSRVHDRRLLGQPRAEKLRDAGRRRWRTGRCRDSYRGY